MASSGETIGNWLLLEEITTSGQSTVFRCLRNSHVAKLTDAVRYLDRHLIHASPNRAPEHQAREIARAISELAAPEPSRELGAFKQFKVVHDHSEAEHVQHRLEGEIKALQNLQHPSIVRLLDANLEQRWIVTEFQPGGTLLDHIQKWRGDILGALTALRPIVEAVALLHERNCVHRDIKPANIFVTHDTRLLLGDFGIIFVDEDASRRTGTLELVGSKDWMPEWARIPERLENVRPTFDVYTLGKILWCMLSGKPMLPLWYHRRPDYDLCRLFPEQPEMELVSQLLDKSVAEDEGACLSSAGHFLAEIDQVLVILRRRGLPLNVTRPCSVCGIGSYQLHRASEPEMTLFFTKLADVKQYGEGTAFSTNHQHPRMTLRVCVCNNCGHCQFFFFAEGEAPAAWRA